MFLPGLPQQSDRCRWFAPTGDNFVANWQLWQAPRGCTMAQMVLLSGGGGGGGGGASNGGGGGGSSSFTSYIFQLRQLPSQLWILARAGGPGGAGGIAGNGSPGTAGPRSLVAIAPTAATSVYVATSSGATTNSVGGGGGGGASPGAGGTAGVVADDSSTQFSVWAAAATYRAGQDGDAGSGSSISPTYLTLGGGGGGNIVAGVPEDGTGFASLSGFAPAFPGGLVDSPGSNGFPYNGIWYGGAGGGASLGSVGGDGGHGINFGAGGGGGGACATVGGRGGDGGPGLVIISCW